jgi:hypothetical protein
VERRQHGAEAPVKEIADDLRAELDRTVPRLRALSEAEAARALKAGGWQKKEILGHLIDSAVNNHQRFVRAQFTDPFVFPGYEQDRWVAVNAYRERAWSELVGTWETANRHLAHVIERVPANRLATHCEIGGEPGTLEWWMRDYLKHLRHHLAQITS